MLLSDTIQSETAYLAMKQDRSSVCIFTGGRPVFSFTQAAGRLQGEGGKQGGNGIKVHGIIGM